MYIGAPQKSSAVARAIRPAIVRHFACGDAIRATLSQAAGHEVTVSALRQSLEQEVRFAVEAITRAASELARSARPPEAVSAFQTAFGLPPTFVPSWRPAGQRWDLGDVVRRRLQRAAEILAGGSIRFTCTNETPVSKGSPGRYAIGLGPTFWEWVREQYSSGTVWALLSSALRIYFGPRLQQQPVGVQRQRIPCYGYFVLVRAGMPLGEVLAICTGRSPSPSSAPTPLPGAPRPSRGASGPKLGPLPKDVLERVVGPPPSRLDLAIAQAVQKAELGSRPQVPLATQNRLGFGPTLDRAMDAVGVPTSWRPLVRKVTKAAAEKGSELLFERGMDQLEIRGETREAIRAILEELWRRAP